MARLLLISPDRDLVEPLRVALATGGYEVRWTTSASSGLSLVDRAAPDVVVLDTVLPDARGPSVCNELRAASRVPIIFVSSQPSRDEAIRCFGAGCDDYVAKAVAAHEVPLRVESLLRRVAWSSVPPTFLRLGDLEIDQSGRVVRRAGRPISLSPSELSVLFALASTPGRPWPADKIARWLGIPVESRRATSELIRLKISRLRRKLEPEPRRPRYVHNQRDAGYLLACTA